MTINLQKPDIRELKPKITVFGVGGGGGNAVNNMINGGLEGVEFVCANTDAQALTMSKAERVIQLGHGATQGLGAGSQPEVGRQAAEECLAEIQDHLAGTNMAFVKLKNAGITSNESLDFHKTKTTRLASENIGNNLYTQIHFIVFTEKSGKKIEVVTKNMASNEECSMSDVEVFVISRVISK